MKIEIGKDFPQYFKPSYPEEFELFSHFEVTGGIPTVLFAITTWKENGKPNVCFHSWSCFHGDKTAFFAVMGNLYQHTHTYANIKREKCFCINFLPISYYDKLVDTIKHNEMETDEFAAGQFTLSNANTIHAPVIQEAFILSLIHIYLQKGDGCFFLPPSPDILPVWPCRRGCDAPLCSFAAPAARGHTALR